MKKIISIFIIIYFKITIFAQPFPSCERYLQKSTVNTETIHDYLYNSWEADKIFLVGNFVNYNATVSSPEEIIFLMAQTPVKIKAGMFGICQDNKMKAIWEKNAFSYSNTFGVWISTTNDRHCIGDFNGDGKDEILFVNPLNGHSQLVHYNIANDYCGGSMAIFPNAWKYLWGNIGNGRIKHWIIQDNDIYLSGDFDGDGKDELLLANPSGYWHLYRFTSGDWLWITGGYPDNPTIGGFSSHNVNHLWQVGKFVNDVNPVTGIAKEQIFAASSADMYNAYGIISFSAADAFESYFLAGGGTSCPDKMFAEKSIVPTDVFYSVNLDNDGISELIRYNRGWRYTMISSDFSDEAPRDCNNDDFNFNLNGKVDFIDYGHANNPKYYSIFLPIFGDFLEKNKTSVMLIYNNRQNYPDLPNWGDYVYMYESTAHNSDSTPTEDWKVDYTNGTGLSIISPNPIIGYLNFIYYSQLEDNIDVDIIDVSGRLVFHKRFNAVDGQNEWRIHLSFLKNGIYIFKYCSKEKNGFHKIAIIKK